MKKTLFLIISSLSIAGLSLMGCTVMLPPSEENIPAADPILLPGKATTIPVNNKINTKTKATEIKSKEAGSGSVDKSTNMSAKAQGTSIALPKAASTSAQGQIYYVVKPKDTVFEVMRQTGVHWKEIIRLNNLKAPSYVIYPGQSLRVR
jgi:LysM repeat protein